MRQQGIFQLCQCLVNRLLITLVLLVTIFFCSLIKMAYHFRKFEFKVFSIVHLNDHNFCAFRELVCNRPLWAKAVLRQLRSYKVGGREHFPATVWWKPWKLGLLFNIVLQQHNSLALRIAIKSLEWRYLGFLAYYSARMNEMDYRMFGKKYLLRCLGMLEEFSTKQ